MIDADLLHRLYDKLWVFFIDNRLLGQPALILVGVLLLIGAEALFRDWEKTAMYRLFFRRSMSAKIDNVYFLVQIFGIAFLLEIVLTFGIALGGARLGEYATNQLSWARITLPDNNLLEMAFSFIVYWIATGLFTYWMHRAYHSPLLWQVHRFHHAAPELNFTTAYRLHPMESFCRAFDLLSPMVILKVPDSVLLVAVIFGNFCVFCQHSELPWKWGWVGRWLFASPYYHQRHHSIDEEHRDVNFSNCPLWDHVFGTYYHGDKVPSAYGIADPAYEQQPFRQFMRDGWIVWMTIGTFLLRMMRKATSRLRPASRDGTALAESIGNTTRAPERISSPIAPAFTDTSSRTPA